MPNIDSHPPGAFCWVELGTTDQPAAKTFYHSLFGWSSNDFPMGPNEIYTMFQLEGRDTGACFTLRPDMIAHGVPPHWMLYVATANADESVEKVKAAGGKVEAGPFDVFTFGRMAVVVDPTGAHFSVWQPYSHKGLGKTNEPGTLCWADLMTRDVPAAKTFYETVFGWKLEPGEKDTSGYLHIKNGSDFIGGVPPSQHMPPNVPPHWMIYFLVQDVDAATEKAKGLGANVLMGPMTMEGVGRWSVVADPQGAAFALFQSLRHD